MPSGTHSRTTAGFIIMYLQSTTAAPDTLRWSALDWCSTINTEHTGQTSQLKSLLSTSFQVHLVCLSAGVYLHMVLHDNAELWSLHSLNTVQYLMLYGAVAYLLCCTPLFVVCASHMQWLSGMWVFRLALWCFLLNQICFTTHIKCIQYFINPSLCLLHNMGENNLGLELIVNFMHFWVVENVFSLRLLIEKCSKVLCAKRIFN